MKTDILESCTYKPEHQIYYDQVLGLTHIISDTYPGLLNWFNNKFISGLKLGNERAYSFVVDGAHLAGVSLLKNAPTEKKICCLFVAPEYRRMGLASQLIQASFKILDTTKPLITVSDNNLSQLQKLLDRYGFELSRSQPGAYRPDLVEYFYNEHYWQSK